MTMEESWDSDVWKIIDAYFRDNDNYLSKTQLDSFNAFLEDAIPKSIRQFNPIVLPYVVKDESSYMFECRFTVGGSIEIRPDGQKVVVNDGQGIYIGKPIIQEVRKEEETGATSIHQKTLYPNEARLKNITYKTEVRADIILEMMTHDDIQSPPIIQLFEKIPIGTFPIMLHSKVCSLQGSAGEALRLMGECEYDQGGYFIIDGKEKVIIGQERQVENKVYVNHVDSQNVSYSAEIRSAPESKFQPARITQLIMYKKPVSRTKKNNFLEDAIRVVVPNMISEIPLTILFRALGIQSDKEILEVIMGRVDTQVGEAMCDLLRNTIIEGQTFHTQVDALEYMLGQMSEKVVPFTASHETRMAFLMDTLRNWFLPHIEDDLIAKSYFLGYMTYQLVSARMGMTKPTDRDSYRFKRVDASGFLMADIFRNLYFRIKNRFIEICNISFRSQDTTRESDFWKQYTVDSAGKRYYNFYKFIGKDDVSSYVAIDKTIDRSIMDDGFMYAFKNCWGLKNMKGGTCKEGVVQDMNRVSYVGYVSHIRRVNTPLNASAKIREPHTLHTSQWGIMCPPETPDGANIGLRKNMAILAKITSGTNSNVLLRVLFENGVESILQTDPEKYKYVKVFLNERYVGYTRDPVRIYTKLKLLKRNALINVYTSVAWRIEEHTLKISTDSGRCIRPVFVVGPNNKLLLDQQWLQDLSKPNSDINWFHLVGGLRQRGNPVPFRDTDPNYYHTDETLEQLEASAGVIEYMDKDEEDTCLIAMTPRDLHDDRYSYTHCEIHPSLVMGIMALTIPLLECNQAPRNQFSAGQGKQALGIYATNFRNRMDTKGMVLHYPQRSIVKNKLERYMFSDELPNGINAIVAVGCYSGYNQDDSILFNKSSVERGLFHSSKFRTYSAREEVEKGKIIERICNPDPAITREMKSGNYRHLDEHGIARVGSKVNENDIVIGKCVNIDETTPDGRTYQQDTSDFIRRAEDGFVDKVYSNVGNDNQRYVKVRVRKQKVPELGDKFCSRHGQKGVCGMLFHKDDLPVSALGIVPDLVVNPQAFPSRMTIAQFTELVMGKACINLGIFSELTAFAELNQEAIGDVLENVCGFERYGNEVMYNGQTGEMMTVNYFIGPTYYQRLVQQVADKYQSRDAGSRTAMTHQPVGGRALGGGGRIGEMERDSLLSHGISSFIQETFTSRSDAYQFVISNDTGRMAVYNRHKQIYRDFMTEEMVQTVQDGEVIKRTIHKVSPGNFSVIEAPYAFKLFLQEVESMGIQPRLITEKVQQQWATDDKTLADSRLALISSDTMDDINAEVSGYYKKTGSDLTKPLRRFHGKIKESMLVGSTLASLRTSGGKRNKSKRLIDFSVGVGGDLMKWMKAGFDVVVGIDKDVSNIEEKEAIDGAKKRLLDLRTDPKKGFEFAREWANRADIRLLVGDSSKDMESLEMTSKHVDSYTSDLKQVIRDIPPGTFDVAAMFFSIHYLFTSETSVDTFFKNVRYSLKPGGHLLVSTLDGEKVFRRLSEASTRLKDKNNDNVWIEGYVKNDTTKHRECVWRIRPGSKLDLSSDSLQPGFNHTVWVNFESIGAEYEEPLVYPPHLIALAKSAGFVLCPIDEVRTHYSGFLYPTGTFDSIYNGYTTLYPEDRDLNDLDRVKFSQLKQYSDLHRYYIFKYDPVSMGSGLETTTSIRACHKATTALTLSSRVEPRHLTLGVPVPMEMVWDRTLLNRRIMEMRGLLGDYHKTNGGTSGLKNLLQHGSEKHVMGLILHVDTQCKSPIHAQLGHQAFKSTLDYFMNDVKVGIYVRYMNTTLVQFTPIFHLHKNILESTDWLPKQDNTNTTYATKHVDWERLVLFAQQTGVADYTDLVETLRKENPDRMERYSQEIGRSPFIVVDGIRLRFGESDLKQLIDRCVAYYDMFRAIPVRDDCECMVNLLDQPILCPLLKEGGGIQNPYRYSEMWNQKTLSYKPSAWMLPVLGATTAPGYTDICIPSASLWASANAHLEKYIPSLCVSAPRGESSTTWKSKNKNYVHILKTELPSSTKETIHITMKNLNQLGVRMGGEESLYTLYVPSSSLEDDRLIEVIREGTVLFVWRDETAPRTWCEHLWIPFDRTKTLHENKHANVWILQNLESDWVEAMSYLAEHDTVQRTLFENLKSLYPTIVNPSFMKEYMAYVFHRIAERITEPFVRTNVQANILPQPTVERIIMVPTDYLPILMGKGGSTVERIRNETHTRIHIDRLSVVRESDGRPVHSIHIEGGEHDVSLAVEVVDRIARSSHAYVKIHSKHRNLFFQRAGRSAIRTFEQKWNVKLLTQLRSEEVVSQLNALGLTGKDLEEFMVFKVIGYDPYTELAKTELESWGGQGPTSVSPLLSADETDPLYRYDESSDDGSYVDLIDRINSQSLPDSMIEESTDDTDSSYRPTSPVDPPPERKMVYILVPKILSALVSKDHSAEEVEKLFQSYVSELREKLTKEHQKGYYCNFRVIVCDTKAGCMTSDERVDLSIHESLIAYRRGENTECLLENKGFLVNSALDVLSRHDGLHRSSHIIVHEPFLMPHTRILGKYFDTSDDGTVVHLSVDDEYSVRNKKLGVVKCPTDLFRSMGGCPDYVWCSRCMDRVWVDKIQSRYVIREEVNQPGDYSYVAPTIARHVNENGHEAVYSFEGNASLFISPNRLRQWYRLENTDHETVVSVEPKLCLYPINDYVGLDSFHSLLYTGKTTRSKMRSDWRKHVLLQLSLFLQARQELPIQIHSDTLEIEINTSESTNTQLEQTVYIVRIVLTLVNEGLSAYSLEEPNIFLLYDYDSKKNICIQFGKPDRLMKLEPYVIVEPRVSGDITFGGIDIRVNVERMKHLHREIEAIRLSDAYSLPEELKRMASQFAKDWSPVVLPLGNQLLYLNPDVDEAVWLYVDGNGLVAPVPTANRLVSMSLVEATNYLKIKDRIEELDIDVSEASEEVQQGGNFEPMDTTMSDTEGTATDGSKENSTMIPGSDPMDETLDEPSIEPEPTSLERMEDETPVDENVRVIQLNPSTKTDEYDDEDNGEDDREDDYESSEEDNNGELEDNVFNDTDDNNEYKSFTVIKKDDTNSPQDIDSSDKEPSVFDDESLRFEDRDDTDSDDTDSDDTDFKNTDSDDD